MPTRLLLVKNCLYRGVWIFCYSSLLAVIFDLFFCACANSIQGGRVRAETKANRVTESIFEQDTIALVVPLVQVTFKDRMYNAMAPPCFDQGVLYSSAIHDYLEIRIAEELKNSLLVKRIELPDSISIGIVDKLDSTSSIPGQPNRIHLMARLRKALQASGFNKFMLIGTTWDFLSEEWYHYISSPYIPGRGIILSRYTGLLGTGYFVQVKFSFYCFDLKGENLIYSRIISFDDRFVRLPPGYNTPMNAIIRRGLLPFKGGIRKRTTS